MLDLGDVADFVDIEFNEIEYLGSELAQPNTSNRLALDLIALIEKAKAPWICRTSLEKILYQLLEDSYRSARVKADAINALRRLEFTDEEALRRILRSSIDVNDFEIRNAIVKFIDGRTHAYRYMTFLLESIPIYIAGQRNSSMSFANDNLISALINAATPSTIVQLLRFVASNLCYLEYQCHSRDFGFNEKEFGKLLSVAANLYSQAPGGLVYVYRIFRRLEYVTMDHDWFPQFRKFFRNTCGDKIIFEKLRPSFPKSTEAASFADRDSCEWLINQYKLKKIDEAEMMQWRNWMPRGSDGIHSWFYERLKVEFGTQFYYLDDGVDYSVVRAEYQVKNQQMIWDKTLLFDEIQKIFQLAGKVTLVSSDFYGNANPLLSAHSCSIAYKRVTQSLRRNAAKTYDDIVRELDSVVNWEWYQLKQIKTILERAETGLDDRLRALATSWCKKQIETMDFSGAVTVDSQEIITIDRISRFVLEMFCLLELKMSDDSLLKMLEADFHIYSEGEKSVSKLVAHQIQDRELLKRTIVHNIKSGKLVFPVLENHFAMCAAFGYDECLRELFIAIINRSGTSYYSLKRLSDQYFQLGGSIEHFRPFILNPMPSDDRHTDNKEWNWYLIEKMANVDPLFVSQLLEAVLIGRDYSEESKSQACEVLFKLGNLRALQFWRNYVLKYKRLLFDGHYSSLVAHVADIKGTRPIRLLIDMLEKVYLTNLHLILKNFDSIETVIYSCLNAIAVSSEERFSKVFKELTSLRNKSWSSDILETLAYKIESIRQQYFQKNEPSVSTAKALALYRTAQLPG